MASLTLSGIGKRFGSIDALSDVNLSVESGEFICLLGASGCGKTTLLRIIAGLETHNVGTVALDGRHLQKIPCHERGIGMVFQSLALFPHLSVGENIAYGPRMRGVAKEVRDQQANHFLQLVGLDDFEHRRISSLSGGQKQRVAIARALAMEPELFLMDEPFSALDAGLRDHLQLEVKQLQKTLGITTVFVTHDQREAMVLADRIVLLNEGVVEQVGTPAEIYSSPATRYVAEFIGVNNLVDIVISNNNIQYGNTNLGRPAGVVKELVGPQTLVIRPEAIDINSASANFSLQGDILMQRQVGAIVEHEIGVSGSVIKHAAFQKDTEKLHVADTVSVSWDWEKISVLPL